jgi:hypothetical protein
MTIILLLLKLLDLLALMLLVLLLLIVRLLGSTVDSFTDIYYNVVSAGFIC